MYGYYSIRVFPFGDLRVNACLQLVVAFRSLPRPSSALSAKASTVCPYSLDLFVPAVSLQPDLFTNNTANVSLVPNSLLSFLLLQRNCLSQFARSEIVFTFYRKTFPLYIV